MLFLSALKPLLYAPEALLGPSSPPLALPFPMMKLSRCKLSTWTLLCCGVFAEAYVQLDFLF